MENKNIIIYDSRETTIKSIIKDLISTFLLIIAFYLNYTYCGASWLFQLFIIFSMGCYIYKFTKPRIFKIKTKEEAIDAVNKIFEE